ncbi:predicted protein [Thalassiosira pseudonana CCMP1335]|uniref:Plastid lipid-associated protein/fibrillin conserved domain-containing protein n=1 Tax=Thalassiosira pseudonana TaxID=35128 RepID=B8C567_THAPS|nr:predicted protein [Thalassiosira pseudonana CCMP1335]EED91456.1 predicted protein [Thalassiosira pseudonana CCMP1335]
MASFKLAALFLASSSVTNGFTNIIGRHNTCSPSSLASSSPLRATSQTQQQEHFQRSLLEARIAYAKQLKVEITDTPSSDENSETTTDYDDTPAPTDSSLDVTATQNSILRIAASTDRGQYAKPTQKDQASLLIKELEANFSPTPTTTDSSTSTSSLNTIPPQLAGTWELLYSNTQLFRSSPFFLAGRSTCKTSEQAAQYSWFCDMHRAALAISNIGVVRQVINSEGRIVNEFEVKVGSVPFLSDFVPFLRYSGGLPITIDGAIVSTADASPIEGNDMEWGLYMDTVEIKGSNVPILRNILDGDNAKLRSRDLSKILEDNVSMYETPRPVLRNTFVDGGMRIVRDEDDNVFLYGRVSDSEDPTNYDEVMADFGVLSLLEGLNDAVTKIYL